MSNSETISTNPRLPDVARKYNFQSQLMTHVLIFAFLFLGTFALVMLFANTGPTRMKILVGVTYGYAIFASTCMFIWSNLPRWAKIVGCIVCAVVALAFLVLVLQVPALRQ